MFAIQVKNIKKTFENIIAVDNVNFNVEKGEIFGFLGPNGAGKTTAIRLLTGILMPDFGNVFIEGIDLVKNPIKAKMMMGVIPEIGNVYADLTAKQNLYLAGKYYGLSKNTLEKKSEELLSTLGLYERRNDPVRTFSKGMKQRVSIACAIIHDPHILFLDEPTEGLDVQSRRLVIETIKHLNGKGSTIFLTTHNIEEANKLCQRVCIINKGKIVAIDKPEILKSTFEKTQSIEISFDQKINRNLFVSDFISKIDLYGDKWRLYTNDLDKTIKRVVTLAQKNDLKIISMKTYGPSLEEVFVRLTEVDR
ncbi:ATP-binding cassette domain-containing protein [Methanococcoides seepicolus]|uniref:ATP-binding cassette domain-containing protein n=1 Tax=Methanococcoides seepicolus TaxID=2828780 RepID=A0A9E4ZG13_9EURY|nr:ATP-binding cassette domain-containing protein [Methanococcoides seepicolus]MCM1987411.1 ATP-binding cassette domain-containing protein [Methanococcoides seepicolus]